MIGLIGSKGAVTHSGETRVSLWDGSEVWCVPRKVWRWVGAVCFARGTASPPTKSPFGNPRSQPTGGAGEKVCSVIFPSAGMRKPSRPSPISELAVFFKVGVDLDNFPLSAFF